MDIAHALFYGDHIMRLASMDGHWWVVAYDAAPILDDSQPPETLLSCIPKEHLREIKCENGSQATIISVGYLISWLEGSKAPGHERFQKWLRGWKIIQAARADQS